MQALWRWIQGDAPDPFAHLRRARRAPPVAAGADDSWYLTEMELLLNRDIHVAKTPVLIDDTVNIMISGFYQLSELPQMQLEHGISHVINMAHGDCGLNRSKGHESRGVKYLGITAEDDDDHDIMSHWDEVITFVNRFNVERQLGCTLLIHCMAGMNRSGAMAVALLATLNEMSLIRAVEQVHRIRGPILTNYSFRQFLINWARQQDEEEVKIQLLDMEHIALHSCEIFFP